jgi:hypothetical protein
MALMAAGIGRNNFSVCDRFGLDGVNRVYFQVVP